jgi:hypothetical protein
MVEYGNVVGQGSGAVGGGGGSFDVTDQIMGALSDVIDRIASLPPLVLVAIAGIMILGWLAWSRRTM